jgi:hypothetical protein
MVGDLGGAVVRHVENHHLPLGRGLSVDAVIADAHAQHRPQLGEARQIGGTHAIAQDHQPVRRRAIGIRQVRQRVRRPRQDHPDVGPKDLALDAVIAIDILRIQHRDRHRFPHCVAGRHCCQSRCTRASFEQCASPDGVASTIPSRLQGGRP